GLPGQQQPVPRHRQLVPAVEGAPVVQLEAGEAHLSWMGDPAGRRMGRRRRRPGTRDEGPGGVRRDRRPVGDLRLRHRASSSSTTSTSVLPASSAAASSSAPSAGADPAPSVPAPPAPAPTAPPRSSRRRSYSASIPPISSAVRIRASTEEISQRSSVSVGSSSDHLIILLMLASSRLLNWASSFPLEAA